MGGEVGLAVKYVTMIPNRLQIMRLFWIGFEFFSESRDLHVDTSVINAATEGGEFFAADSVAFFFA